MDQFKGLNYSFLNEDPRVEARLVHPEVRRVLTVAGSGLRVQYLIQNPDMDIHVCDLSKEQLAFTHLRLMTVRDFDFATFRGFWGFDPSMIPAERRDVFGHLDLLPEYRELLESIFEVNKWMPPLYFGKYEKRLIRLSRVLRGLFGLQKQEDSEIAHLRQCVGSLRWRGVIGGISLAAWWGTRGSGEIPAKDDSRSFFQIYDGMMRELLEQENAAQNPFLGMVFWGEVTSSKLLPIEESESEFLRIKENIASARLQYRRGSLFSLSSLSGDPYDLVSLSNITSYLDANGIQAGMGMLSRALSLGGRVVQRTFLRHHDHLVCQGLTQETVEDRDDFASFYRLKVLTSA